MRQVSSVTSGCAIAAVLGGFMIGNRISDYAEFVLGCVIILIAAMTWLSFRIIAAVQEVNRPADQAFEDGFEMGRAKGYTEGRRAGGLSSVSDINSESQRKATG